MSSSSLTPFLGTPRTIEIIVETDGSTRVETQGYTGASCKQASAFIERALGQVIGETLKPDFHQVANQTQQQTERA